MKFFTAKWWCEGGGGSAQKKYNDRISEISCVLPSELLDFLREANLHDSVACSQVEVGRYVLKLNGWNQDFSEQKKYVLVFSGVIGEAPSVEENWGEVGYCEVDLWKNIYEFRVIFSSMKELCVRFSDFEFNASPG